MTPAEAGRVLAGLVGCGDVVRLGHDEREALAVAVVELARDGRPGADTAGQGEPVPVSCARPSFSRYRC
jgi:hypothetical protein